MSVTDCPFPNVSFLGEGRQPRKVKVVPDPDFKSEGYVVGDTFLILWWLKQEAFDKEKGRCFLPCKLKTYDVEDIHMTTAGRC